MHKKKHSEENSERWLLTYADMLTLLFVLFVLLFAISNVDATKYQLLAKSLNSALGSGESAGNGASIFEGGAGLLDGGASITDSGGQAETQAQTGSSSSTNSATSTTQAATKSPEQTELEGAKGNIDKIISENNLGGEVSNTIQDSGLVITFPSSIVFDSGKAEVKDAMKNALNQIAPELNKLNNDIFVMAYTDNVRIDSALFPSNWQLSCARASNVVLYLVTNCNVNTSRLYAVGRGENDPIATNDTPEGRSQNRRIEIFVKYSSKGIR